MSLYELKQSILIHGKSVVCVWPGRWEASVVLQADKCCIQVSESHGSCVFHFEKAEATKVVKVIQKGIKLNSRK